MASGRTLDMRSGARSVRVRAPGKINVSLTVGPPREDGYHGIASVFLAVSLYEEVTATETSGAGIGVSVNGEGTLNLPAASIPLAMHRLLQEQPQLSGGLALQIGFGAGLVYGAQVVRLP